MTNTGYYDWHEILSNFDDKELFNAFVDRNSIPERKITAEKILLERGIIKKNAEGIYIKEEIEKEYLLFVAYNLKKESQNETIKKLIKKGLDKASSVKLVNSFLNWKKKNIKFLKP